MSWVLIWHSNWMTRDSSPSLPHESAEFSWLAPPTSADYRRWAGMANCLRPIQVLFVSPSHHPDASFQGAAETTHSPTLQSEGLYRGHLLMGIWRRGGSCELNQLINGHSSFLARRKEVLLGSDGTDKAKCRQSRGFLGKTDDLLKSKDLYVCLKKTIAMDLWSQGNAAVFAKNTKKKHIHLHSV